MAALGTGKERQLALGPRPGLPCSITSPVYSCRVNVLNLLAASLILLSIAETQEKGAQPRADREAFVQLLLENHCIKCHGARKAKGGIRLDRLDQRIAHGFDLCWVWLQ